MSLYLFIQAIENCIATAGFSLGEYAALVFAGSMSFEGALNIVKVRAEAMQVQMIRYYFFKYPL